MVSKMTKSCFNQTLGLHKIHTHAGRKGAKPLLDDSYQPDNNCSIWCFGILFRLSVFAFIFVVPFALYVCSGSPLGCSWPLLARSQTVLSVAGRSCVARGALGSLLVVLGAIQAGKNQLGWPQGRSELLFYMSVQRWD